LAGQDAALTGIGVHLTLRGDFPRYGGITLVIVHQTARCVSSSVGFVPQTDSRDVGTHVAVASCPVEMAQRTTIECGLLAILVARAIATDRTGKCGVLAERALGDAVEESHDR
jgi:hypothetical protein